MPYFLWNFNKFLLAFLVHHGNGLAVDSTMTKGEIIRIIDPNANNPTANYDQARAFNEDLELVERVGGSNTETLRITQEGFRYLELGHWQQREMTVPSTDQKEMFVPANELERYSGRGGSGGTYGQKNFGLNEGQIEYVLRNIIKDNRISEALIQGVHSKLRYSILYYMRFVHIEPSHWSPKNLANPLPTDIFTDERIDIFNDVFDIGQTNDPRNVRNTLTWSANYCQELGLVVVVDDGRRSNTASFTEKGSRIYQLLELREYLSLNGLKPPTQILNPYLGAVPHDDEVNIVMNM